MSAKLAKLLAALKTATAFAPMLYVPVSGGSDSALTFWLLNQAAPGRVVGIHCRHEALPTVEEQELRCLDWFEKVGKVDGLLTECEEWKIREEIMWAKFLAASLGKMRHSWPTPGWLVGCRNRTEDVLGTYSLASRVATFLPIVELWKTEVLALCTEAGVPQEIIDGSRRADPNCGRPIEMAEIPVEKIDRWLNNEINVCKACNDGSKASYWAVNPCSECPVPCTLCVCPTRANRCNEHWCRCACHPIGTTWDPELAYIEKIRIQNYFKHRLPIRLGGSRPELNYPWPRVKEKSS